jgi:hypothetical protein
MHDVFVPTEGSRAWSSIDRGSGIVGSPLADGWLLLDYEGNRYGAANIKSYADRVKHAAGRQRTLYPTVARMHADPSDVIKVGEFDPNTGLVTVGKNAPADENDCWNRLAHWLGIRGDEMILDDLRTTS